MATSSPLSKYQRWNEIWMQYWLEQQMSVPIAVPYSKAQSNITMAASDLSRYTPSNQGLLPPPSILVSSSIDAMCRQYAPQLKITRFNAMKNNFRSLCRIWFIDYVNSFCPEETHHLASSYHQTFQEALMNDEILIASDLEYAGEVEAMTGVTWSKPGTKEHFAQEASKDLNAIIPQFLARAYQHAIS